MPRLIYDFTKNELENVSFDPNLFKRTLKRAAKNLLPYEIEQLQKWLNYYTQNKPDLKDCLIEINFNNKGVC